MDNAEKTIELRKALEKDEDCVSELLIHLDYLTKEGIDELEEFIKREKGRASKNLDSVCIHIEEIRRLIGDKNG